ncbi:MAG: hypothetical protein ACTTIC_01125 [Helicobacteraceae bacterium]
MPIPFIVGAVAALAGAAGIGAGFSGADKMKDAKNIIDKANARQKKNEERFKRANADAITVMDELGKLELSILDSFRDFQDLVEKIQRRPEFKAYKKDDVSIPKYNGQKIEEVSVAAAAVLGGLGGAGAGVGAGFAAAGATTLTVGALGTASTGIAISSLSGAAATNATLAALGGGSLASGGGGMALGSAILGGATLGVGLLAGGIILDSAGSSVLKKADKVWDQMLENEEKIDGLCNYMSDLKGLASQYISTLNAVYVLYKRNIATFSKAMYGHQGVIGKLLYGETM